MTQQLDYTASPGKDIIRQLFHSTSYMNAAAVLDGLTPEQATTRPDGLPHSVAEVVAHAHFWLSWVLNIARGGVPVPTPNAAVGWPEVKPEAWETLRTRFLQAIESTAEFTQQELDRPLFTTEYYGWEKNSLGATLTGMAIHNAHHLGQVVTIRQALKLWPPPAGPYTW